MDARDGRVGIEKRARGARAWGAAVSVIAHAGVLLVAAFSAPDSAPARGEASALSDGRPFLVFASGGWAEPEAAEGGPAEVTAVGTEGEPSRCGGRAPKAMGTRVARVERRFGIAGPRDNADPHMARMDGTSSSGDPAMGGVVSATVAHAPTVRWGRDDAFGNDESSAKGGMWGDVTGNAAGMEGMAPAGMCDECGGSAGRASAETSAIGGVVRMAIRSAPLLGRGGGLARGFSGTVGARPKR